MGKMLVLISDSTGELGEQFLRSLVTQFPDQFFGLKVYSFVDSEETLRPILEEIWKQDPIIFHTVVHASLKKRIGEFAERNGFPVFDLTGPAVGFLEQVSGVRSQPRPRAAHELNEEYDQRIRALDFTIRHDDGINTEQLEKADLVLIGVSRTSKTPTSIYLANKGYRVANVPLVRDTPLPERLFRRPHLKMVGLMIEPEKLQEIRLRRAREENIPGERYTDLNAIREELDWAHSTMLELGCPIVDVTRHAVEETAALVLKALHLR